MKIAKVKDEPGLIRDIETKAILASDFSKYDDHKQKKNLLKKLINQSGDIDQLKQDLLEIKFLLHKLVTDK